MANHQIPTDPTERAAWVMAALRLRRRSFAAIARDLAISQQSVRHALFQPSARVEARLAEELGMNVQDLFPERYSVDGSRLVHTRKHNSGGPIGRNVESGGAA